MPWMMNPQFATNCLELSLEGAVGHDDLHGICLELDQLHQRDKFEYALVDMQEINWCTSSVKIHEFVEVIQQALQAWLRKLAPTFPAGGGRVGIFALANHPCVPE